MFKTFLSKQIKLLMCVAVSAPSLCVAQDFRQSMLSIQETLKKSDRLHVVMSIKVFDQKSSGALMFSENADIKKDGNNFLYTLGGNDMLMGEKYILSVDRAETLITLGKRNKTDEKKIDSFLPVSIDSILSHYSLPRYLGETPDGQHYTLAQKKGAVSRMDIYLDSKNGVPKIMDYEYRDGQRVLVKFGEFNSNPLFASGTFDESNYIKFVKGTATGVGNFSSYQVITKENY